MKMMKRVPVLGAIVPFALACHSGPGAGSRPEPTGANLAMEAAAPCSLAATNPTLATWREVRATGFTFCLPADWHPGGSTPGRVWHHEFASIEWRTGTYRPTRIRQEIVEVPAGSPLPDQPPNGQVDRFTETIGGQTADLWRNRLGGDFFTGAKWTTPAVYIIGKADGMTTAELEIRIYRTVRFTGP